MKEEPLSPSEPNGEKVPRVGVVREYYETILVSVLFILYTWTFVVMQSKIPTASMQDTLLVGDRVIVNKFVFGADLPWLRAALPYRAIERGNVVVFKSPEDPEKDFIKRVIAVGGDRLEIIDKQVYVNGVALAEPYAHFNDPRIYTAGDDRNPYGSRNPRDNMAQTVIPEGTYFMMGDNRDNSNDSRVFGPVRRDYIKGRAVLIFWSIQQPGLWNDPAGQKAWNVLKSAANFFRWTRWNRLFRPVH